jgi:Cys-rich protein (TIGR01571 family)
MTTSTTFLYLFLHAFLFSLSFLSISGNFHSSLLKKQDLKNKKKINHIMSTNKKDDDDAVVAVADTAVAVAAVDGVVAFAVPSGSWRSGLCNCCSACFCPCMMGWCCFPILLGQLMERLKFNAFGCPNANGKKSGPICATFTVLFLIVVCIQIATQIGARQAWECVDYNDGAGNITPVCNYNYNTAPLYYQILIWPLIIWVWFIFIASCCTRMNMRKQHKIDPLCCGDNCCDDCLTTWCCNCCSTIQMIRQTHNEDEYPYKISSRTGLDSSAPEINIV